MQHFSRVSRSCDVIRKKLQNSPAPCLHQSHQVPMHICLPPGVYEHTCEGCGQKIEFTVNGVFL